jgi:integrase/recombinase XerD
MEPAELAPQSPTPLAPLGDMVVLGALTGRDGSNRSRAGHCQISANTDQEAVLAWLARYVDSPNTLASARREAERLLLWAVTERGVPLSSLTHEDLLIYRRFLADPQPAERWVMARQSMTVLNSLLAWLVEAGYLAGNPLSLSKRRRKAAAPRVTRFLEADLWTAVRETILTLPQETPRERAVYARARWLFSLFFLAGLRISEVVGNGMGDFFMRSDAKTGEPRWWLQALGKGDKERLVPATTELMVELMAYRRSLELSDLPDHGEPSPLLFPVAWRRSKHPAPGWPEQMTRSAVHGVVKAVFAAAADRWLEAGRGQEQAEKLKAASAHWMRHTAGSNLADEVDLRHVRDTLGHVSLTTTSIYVHGEDDARHAAVSASHRIGWQTPIRSGEKPTGDTH